MGLPPGLFKSDPRKYQGVARRVDRRADSGNRGLRPTAAEPEFPDQRVWRPASDAHPSLMDPEEVVRGADADLVRLVVAAAMGAVLDVVLVHGGTAAAR